MSFGAACIFLRGGKNIVSTRMSWWQYWNYEQCFVSLNGFFFFLQSRQLAEDEIDGKFKLSIAVSFPSFVFEVDKAT